MKQKRVKQAELLELSRIFENMVSKIPEDHLALMKPIELVQRLQYDANDAGFSKKIYHSHILLLCDHFGIKIAKKNTATPPPQNDADCNDDGIIEMLAEFEKRVSALETIVSKISKIENNNSAALNKLFETINNVKPGFRPPH